MSAPVKPNETAGCIFGCGLLVLAVLIGSVAVGAAAAVVGNLVQAGWEAVR